MGLGIFLLHPWVTIKGKGKILSLQWEVLLLYHPQRVLLFSFAVSYFWACVFFVVCQEILQIVWQGHWWCTNYLLTIWREGNSHRKRKIGGDCAFTEVFSHLQLKKLELNKWSLPKNSGEAEGEPKDPAYSADGFCINHLTSLYKSLVSLWILQTSCLRAALPGEHVPSSCQPSSGLNFQTYRDIYCPFR